LTALRSRRASARTPPWPDGSCSIGNASGTA
jgi:hypothetical protein